MTWNANALGITDLDGGCPSFSVRNEQESVNRTDAYGATQIDGIYQGGNWSAEMVCIEWRTGSIAALWPFGAFGVMGVIGRLAFGLSAPLVFNVVPGTPAQTLGPGSMTMSKAIIAPGFDTRILFGPTLRKVPLRFSCLPFTSGGIVVWMTTT